MWVGTLPQLEDVGVWVICCGVQGDAPMRQMLIKGLGTAAERGCDQFGLLAKKGAANASKYLGYISPCAVETRDKNGKKQDTAMGWANGVVKKGSSKRPLGCAGLPKSHFLSKDQMQGRDEIVDKAIK
jgi:hypothetical protein